MVDESIRIENVISITGNGNIGVIIQLKAPRIVGVPTEPRIQFQSRDRETNHNGNRFFTSVIYVKYKVSR